MPPKLKMDEKKLRVLWFSDLTRQQVADELGCSIASVMNYATKLGLPRRKRVLVKDRAEYPTRKASPKRTSEVTRQGMCSHIVHRMGVSLPREPWAAE